jgi:hypothetical protein
MAGLFAQWHRDVCFDLADMFAQGSFLTLNAIRAFAAGGHQALRTETI